MTEAFLAAGCALGFWAIVALCRRVARVRRQRERLRLLSESREWWGRR